MQTHIALLRSINVGGKHKLPMADLRKIMLKTGIESPKTYIQSGNVVFKAPGGTSQHWADGISNAILDSFGYQIRVLVITPRQFQKIMSANPFTKQDLSRVYLTFPIGVPAKGSLENLPASPNPRERFNATPECIYVFCPDGYGRAKINNQFFEKHLGMDTTTRNWKTCRKISEMAAESPGHSINFETI